MRNILQENAERRVADAILLERAARALGRRHRPGWLCRGLTRRALLSYARQLRREAGWYGRG